MQKKYKRAIIISSITTLITTIVLVLLGLSKIELDQYGLNYSTISAIYADEKVYGPGLYWIGLTNKFIRIKKNQQSLSFKNLTTFSSDFYQITANIQANLLFNLNSDDPFQSTSQFYEFFGQNPNQFIQPIFKNEMLIILSSKTSSYYRTTSSVNIDLQTQISKQLQNILSQWINSTVNIIIQSVICQGTTINTEIIDREIQSLEHDIQRASSQKIELSDYFSNMLANKRAEIQSAKTAIELKTMALQRILNKYGPNTTGLNISHIIYDNMPLAYDMDLVNILEELAAIGNRTFPY